MIKSKIGLGALFLTLGLTLYQSDANGQTSVMNLEQCLEYAKENNITLKQANLEIDNSSIDEKIAKNAFLPKISASVSQGLTNNPFVDGTKNAYTGSYGVDLSMALYTGGSNSLALKQSKLDTQINKYEYDVLSDNLQVSITQLYVEILYATEQIEVVQYSLELSEKNIERGEKKYKLGSINEADLATLKSDKATQQYNLAVAQTTLNQKYLQLKQLLEIKQGAVLKIADEDLESKVIVGTINSVDEVYADAMKSRPEIKGSELAVESALYDQKIAKAAFLPTLSLSGGLGLSHSSSSDFSFSTQLKNKYAHSLGLNLSVPIFNRFNTRNSVLKSKNAVKYAELSHEQEAKDLYQTIESLHTNAVNAKALFEASEAKLEALEISLKLTTKQFEVGVKDIIELLTQQDEYRTTSQQYLENKYSFMLSQTILNYYQSGIIKL